ncbi:hypothetical protein N800_06760 [Lysobacter daejeonensis GH1-9]|uniref:Uncharacterized protein n=1 Tax=Lysobacter daejeonensis GH1-9 TaxID=1385517 RepID=A0A0A0EVV8_9GAMM|nr:hypothetical protein N800_06760 [Lysobacter daejeonensis GH1-9]
MVGGWRLARVDLTGRDASSMAHTPEQRAAGETAKVTHTGNAASDQLETQQERGMLDHEGVQLRQ